MEENNSRGVRTLLGVGVAFFLIAVLMKASGTATPTNPAWTFISIVAQVFIWPLVLLLGSWVAAIPFVLITVVTASLDEKVRERRQKALYKLAIIAKNEENARRQKQLEQEEKARQVQANLRAIEQQQKEKELRIQESERRKARSPEDALEEAMDDFG